MFNDSVIFYSKQTGEGQQQFIALMFCAVNPPPIAEKHDPFQNT
jgi:hypothetical protein